MKPFAMNYFTNWDMTMLSSLGALILSYVSDTIEMPDIMAWISAVSAVILCLTSIIKFIDLIVDKYKRK
jgi:hypothetical protein